MRILNNSNTDYTVLALQNNLRIEKIYTESVLDIMVLESEFIDTCLEMGQIVTEALSSTEVEVTKKRNIFDRILDAIQALFGTFKEKVTVLMDRNNEWLKANLVYINKKTISSLGEVELIPYWTRTADSISNALQDITNTLINKTKGSPEQYSSMEELTKIVRQKIGGKSDLASDAKNFFRTGKLGAEPKRVTINGPSLAVYLDEMYNYVVQYDKVVVPRLNKFMNNIKNTVNTMKNNAKMESFCFLENAYYNDTEIGLFPNMNVLLEADTQMKDKQLQDGKIDDNPKNQSLTSVKVSSTNSSDGEGGEGNKENSAKVTEYCKNLTNILKILQGAALTVLEEKYITYINLFKVVVQNAKPAKTKSAKPEEDTTDEGKETKKKTKK